AYRHVPSGRGPPKTGIRHSRSLCRGARALFSCPPKSMRPKKRLRIRFFAGPTLAAGDIYAACADLDAHVRVLPPIQQGDLLQLMYDWPDVLGVIDGYFCYVPAVLHKEILIALERGIRILGAASLGALRAAELDSFGMEGVGEIYRMYKTGQIDGDDEVA